MATLALASRAIQLGFVCLIVPVTLVGAAVSAGAQTALEDFPERVVGRIYDISAATTPIKVDGAIDEAAWNGATSISLDYEVEPGENIEPPVQTECLITYDDSHVYFAFKATDPNPGEIRARLSDRDSAWDDDWVGVVLDTFNDQRRAYEMFSNPLGVQIDAINDEVGQNYDDSWNAIWTSAGRITSTGFEVEMAVPFHQVRFQRIDGDQVWGFDALRSYPRDFRHHITAFPRDRAVNSYLSQAIKIRGMRGADPGNNMEVIPTVTSSRSDVRPDTGDSSFDQGPVLSDVGVTLRWGITPNLSLNGAINPDFSQIEADALQLDVNEQFALFFRETRPFFLEGADYFNSDQLLIHTRSIASPLGAGKLTGKQGSHTWGIFSARDQATNVLVPGADGSSSGSYDFENTSSAARYRYDFGSNSTIGTTVTDRRGSGYANSVYSGDTVLNFNDTDRLRASAAVSHTQYNAELQSDLGEREAARDDIRLLLDYAHQERGWWVNLNLDHAGEDFRTDLGFQPQVGYDAMWLGGAKVSWGNEGDVIQRRALGLSFFRQNRTGAGLLGQEVSSWFNARLPKQTHFSVSGHHKEDVFEGRRFSNLRGDASLSTRVSGDFNVAFNVSTGGAIDYSGARSASRLFLFPSARYTFGRHLNVRVLHIYSRLNIDEGRLFTVHAPELRAVYQFNSRAFVRLVMQYRHTRRDPDLYPDAVEKTTETLLTQFLLSYKVNPQTAVYMGYGDNSFGDTSTALLRTDRTFFAKLSYAWVR